MPVVIWDLIRDWFVTYIFGGITSSGDIYGGVISQGEYVESPCFIGPNGQEVCADPYYEFIYADQWTFTIGGQTISLGDWLSTTATIITLIALVVFFYFIIRYLFRLTSGLIRGR